MTKKSARMWGDVPFEVRQYRWEAEETKDETDMVEPSWIKPVTVSWTEPMKETDGSDIR